jgi:hypothetical protein
VREREDGIRLRLEGLHRKEGNKEEKQDWERKLRTFVNLLGILVHFFNYFQR